MDINTFEKHKRLMLESLGITTEGVDDPIIFKAVFMAGGPGSGKSYIVRQIGFEGMGFKVLNSDDVYEVLLKRAGLKLDPEDIYSPKGQEIRGRAKAITYTKEKLWADGRIGIVVDGTGKEYDKISKSNKWLKDLGYETMMVLVNTDLKTAQARNMARARKLPPQEVEAMWNGVQSNIGKFQSLFGGENFIVVDNSEAQGEKSGNFASGLYGKINAWAKKVPNNPIAQDWINSQGGKI
jgi:dephospho-CoA kinase